MKTIGGKWIIENITIYMLKTCSLLKVMQPRMIRVGWFSSNPVVKTIALTVSHSHNPHTLTMSLHLVAVVFKWMRFLLNIFWVGALYSAHIYQQTIFCMVGERWNFYEKCVHMYLFHPCVLRFLLCFIRICLTYLKSVIMWSLWVI